MIKALHSRSLSAIPKPVRRRPSLSSASQTYRGLCQIPRASPEHPVWALRRGRPNSRHLRTKPQACQGTGPGFYQRRHLSRIELLHPNRRGIVRILFTRPLPAALSYSSAVSKTFSPAHHRNSKKYLMTRGVHIEVPPSTKRHGRCHLIPCHRRRLTSPGCLPRHLISLGGSPRREIRFVLPNHRLSPQYQRVPLPSQRFRPISQSRMAGFHPSRPRISFSLPKTFERWRRIYPHRESLGWFPSKRA